MKDRMLSAATLALLALLLAAMGAKSWLVPLPEVRPQAAQGSFDTGRAMARLARVLGDQRPHPVDTPANDAVRDRLIAELRAIGLAPRVADSFTCNGGGTSRNLRCARVRNVLATIGPAEGRHVLVASHYDSTPVGPGAADDGIGMAVMLETASLLARRDLKRPVTFLFDEGEEAGLLGARAFLDQDPLAGRVAALVNFESRGVTGPATMFETSSPNGAALGHFARSVRHASANSLATDMAKLIPNSTDVEVFRSRPWTILNFAIIGNETRYHSPGDRIEALDPRSVQHMGDQGLAVIADLAAGTPLPGAGGEKIYADVAGGKLVVLPAIVGLAGVALLLLGWAAVGWRRRERLGRSIVAVVSALTGAAALAFVAQWLVGLVRPGAFWRAHPEAISLAVDAAALAANIAALLWAARAVETSHLRPAFWLVFMIFGAAICAIAPGGSIFFLAPPLVALAGVAASKRIPSAKPIAGWVAALLLFLTWVPLLALAQVLLDFRSAWLFAPVSALIILPVLIEAWTMLAAMPRRLALGSALAAVLACWGVAGSLPAYSADRKQAFGIEYVSDGADKRGRWLVVNDGARLPDAFDAAGPWRRRGEVPWSTRPRWEAAAPGRLTPPTAVVLANRMEAGGRRLALRIGANGYHGIALRAPPGALIAAASVNGSGRRFGQPAKPKEPFQLRCEGRSCDEMVVELLVRDREKLDWTLIGTRAGLPPEAAPLVAARPRNAAPQYTPDASIAMARLRL
jgi:hypothetical protein